MHAPLRALFAGSSELLHSQAEDLSIEYRIKRWRLSNLSDIGSSSLSMSTERAIRLVLPCRYGAQVCGTMDPRVHTVMETRVQPGRPPRENVGFVKGLYPDVVLWPKFACARATFRSCPCAYFLPALISVFFGVVTLNLKKITSPSCTR